MPSRCARCDLCAVQAAKTNSKAKARLWDLTCEVPKATPPAIGLTKSTASAETAAAKTAEAPVEQAEKAGRQDIADREAAEIVVIEEYLPQLMQGAELEAAVRGLAAEIGYSGPSDKGRFMKEWMARYKGRAEGRDVQTALGQLG